jgi:hypothetical protein
VQVVRTPGLEVPDLDVVLMIGRSSCAQQIGDQPRGCWGSVLHRPQPNRCPSRAALDEQQIAAFVLFANGCFIDEFAKGIGRTRPAVVALLCDFITSRRLRSVRPWISDEDLADLRAAVATIGADSVADLREELCGEVEHNQIHIGLAFLAGGG